MWYLNFSGAEYKGVPLGLLGSVPGLDRPKSISFTSNGSGFLNSTLMHHYQHDVPKIVRITAFPTVKRNGRSESVKSLQSIADCI